MTWQGKSVLAVIPARGGSKSIPRKNLVKLDGISLVGRAIKIALSIPWIDHIILSTDDEEIAAEGRLNGIKVPFMRPTELAGDKSNSIEMWRQVWLTSEDYFGVRFDYSLLLEPTSPLRNSADVERTMCALTENNHEAAATFSRTPAHYTPHKTLTIDQVGIVGFYLPEGARHSLRQSIPPYYHRNGICYAVRRDTLVERGTIIESNCAAVLIDRHVVNIDEMIDLKLAEFLLTEQKRVDLS